MRIPISDAIHDAGNLKPVTVHLERRQIEWLEAFGEARNVSTDQAVRYIVNRFIRNADSPEAGMPNEDARSDAGSLLSDLKATYARLNALKAQQAEEHDGEPDATSREAEDKPSDPPSRAFDAPSMFEIVEEQSPSTSAEEPSSVEVRFGGDWSSEARTAVRDALHHLEAKRQKAERAPVQPVWMCTAVAADDGNTFYFATRQGEDSVIRALTPPQLIDRVEHFLHSG